MKYLLRLSKLTAPLLPVMLLAIVFGVAGFFCAIGVPVFGAMALVSPFSLRILVVLGIARGILHYMEQYCNHYIAFKILARIRDIVFRKLRSLGPAKMEAKEKGNMVSLLTSDIELLEVFYAHTISPVCIAVLVSAGMCAFIFQYSQILCFIALSFYAIVGIAVPLCVNRFAVKFGTVYRKDFADMNSFMVDCLRGISMSIMYGTGAKKLSEIRSRSDALSQSQKKMALVEGLTQAVSGLFVTLGAVTMLSVSLCLFRKNGIGFDAVIVCTVAMFSSFGPVISVANLGSGLSQTIASARRVVELLDEMPVVDEVRNNSKIEFTDAELKNVDFTYPKTALRIGRARSDGEAIEGESRNPGKPDGSNASGMPEKILDNLSFSFSENKIIGLRGKSGSGKSTVLKLLMHFWKAESGSVEISGENINGIDSENLRKMECYVTQETVLFHDTIENNLKIARQDAKPEEIVEACKKARIHDFIDSLPKKYGTKVSELGDNFSGGERQRLGLARAFLHGGKFLLLDEPTSNLDSWNEHEIMKSVKEESENKTVVIVSHRDSTFEFADEIINLESGRKS